MTGKKVAEDIMVPIDDYNTIPEYLTLYEAISILRNSFHRDGKAWHGHRSVIVVDGKGNLVGVLSLNEILKAAGLKELDDDPNFKAESWGWYYIKHIREHVKLRVKDVMRPLAVATVDAADEVVYVALSLLKHKVNSLPVMKKGRLIGMVRTMDIFMVIGNYFKY